MSTRADYIGVVEAAYDLSGDDEGWLKSVVEAAKPLLDTDYGVTSYIFDYSGAIDSRARVPITVGPMTTGPAWTAERTSELMSKTPPSAAELCLLASPGFYNFQERWLCAEDLDRLQIELDYMRGEFGVSAHQGGVIAVEPSGSGMTMFGFSREPQTPTAQEKSRWSQATVHIATAMRLRRAFRKMCAEEAILEPDGKCAHAELPAQSRSSRESLRDAVRAIDRARGKARRKDQDGALAIWKGLCSGRWSLVDRFESDGRRFVVAFRNDPNVRDPRALTARERQIAAHIALGYSNKLIAYALGLSISTVGWHLSRAMRKLGVASRTELVRLFAAMGPH